MAAQETVVDLYEEKDKAAATEFLTGAADALQRAQDYAGEGKVAEQLGYLHSKWKDKDGALKYFTRALSAYVKAKDSAAESRITYQIKLSSARPGEVVRDRQRPEPDRDAAAAAFPRLEIDINGKVTPLELNSPLEIVVGKGRARIVVQPVARK